MVNELLKQYKEIYRSEMQNCLEFWERFCLDKEEKGYFTCLDRKGEIYGYDKSVWFQGRGLYTFSKYFNDFDRSEKWIDAAKSGYDFLLKQCFDTDGRMFFTVTRDGKPIQKRRYYFSETFAVVGCAEYYKLSGDLHALEKARDIFHSIIRLYQNPQLLTPKYNPQTLPVKGLAVPMILTTTTQTLREADPENAEEYSNLIRHFTNEITSDFLKPDKKALFETVGENGAYLDTPMGRTVNPGHSIEASWFLMKEAVLNNDRDLLQKALTILNGSFDIGWDKEYGGILYFVDIDHKPSEKLEWDMKLWWPHCEALIAFLAAYQATGDETYFEKFRLVHDYTFEHFRDTEYGEWFGYLHRDGTVSNDLKGNLFKGPFHIPRALMLCYSMLKDLSAHGSDPLVCS